MLELAPAPARQTSEVGSAGEMVSNLELSSRLQRVEPAAWRELYVNHHRIMRSIISAHLGYGPDVDDVVQGVFETGLELVSRGRVRLSGNELGIRAWLIAIALRLAKTELRRRKKQRTVKTSSTIEEATPPFDDTGFQLLERTRAVLCEMSDRLRLPWVLRHFEHMSLEEVAGCLGLSLATVKRRLAAADQRFMCLARRDAVLRERLNDGAVL